MKQFAYTIQNPNGIHGRPAMELAKLARTFAGTTITISKGEKSAQATALLKLMSLDVGSGDTVTVTIDGLCEMAATVTMQNYFWNHL